MRIEKATVEHYATYLKDKYRPPSRGGNTRAWHQHVLRIDGASYAFLALGTKKWVYVSDQVSFDWNWDQTGKYRNIDPTSLRTWDSSGKEVVRGERGTKPWRTAPTRVPGSRRERRD